MKNKYNLQQNYFNSITRNFFFFKNMEKHNNISVSFIQLHFFIFFCNYFIIKMGNNSSKININNYLDNSLKYEPIKEIKITKDGWVYNVKNKKYNRNEIAKIIIVHKKDENDIFKFFNAVGIISKKMDNHIVHYSVLKYVTKKSIIISMPEYLKCLLNYEIENMDNITICNALSDICNGLYSIHKENCIHGSLKPSNIFQDGKEWLISDYCEYLLYKDYSNFDIEDYRYFSPEIIKALPITSASDMWSFGCIVYYFISGKHAFSDKNMADLKKSILSKSYESLDSKNQSLINLIEKLLIIDDTKRITSKEVINILQNNRNNYVDFDYIEKKIDNNEMIDDNELSIIKTNKNIVDQLIEKYSLTHNIQFLCLLAKLYLKYKSEMGFIHETMNMQGEDPAIIELWDRKLEDERFYLNREDEAECNDRYLLFLYNTLPLMKIKVLDLTSIYFII